MNSYNKTLVAQLGTDEDGETFVDVPWKMIFGTWPPFVAFDESSSPDNRTCGDAAYMRFYVDTTNERNQ